MYKQDSIDFSIYNCTVYTYIIYRYNIMSNNYNNNDNKIPIKKH